MIGGDEQLDPGAGETPIHEKRRQLSIIVGAVFALLATVTVIALTVILTDGELFSSSILGATVENRARTTRTTRTNQTAETTTTFPSFNEESVLRKSTGKSEEKLVDFTFKAVHPKSQLVFNAVFKLTIKSTTSDGNDGDVNASGFLCKFQNTNDSLWLYGLMTNNHVIGQELLNKTNENKTIVADFQGATGENTTITLIVGRDTTDVWFTNKTLDVTFVKLPPHILREIRAKKLEFLPLSPSEVKKEQIVVIFQYPHHSDLLTNLQQAQSRVDSLSADGYTFNHAVSTLAGSSGSPVLDKATFQVIGLHKGYSEKKRLNVGTTVQAILAAITAHGLKASPLFNVTNDEEKNAEICHIFEEYEIKSDKEIAALSDDRIREVFASSTALIGYVTYYRNETKAKLYDVENQFFTACDDGTLRQIEKLLEKKQIGLNMSYSQSKHAAIGGELLEDGFNCLMLAARKGHAPVVEFLLQQQELVNVNEKTSPTGMSALAMAAEKGYLPIVKRLLNNTEININDKQTSGWTALMMATVVNHLPVVEYLVNQSGININEKGNKGETALLFAAMLNHVQVLEFLVKQPGINVNEKDSQGNPVFLAAAKEDRVGVLKILAKHAEININEKDSSERNALMFAANRGHLPVVEFLVKQPNIKINEQDEDKRTALMYAAQKGNVEIVEFLINQPNVNINAKDKLGLTALLLAVLSQKPRVVECLVKHPGIDINDKDQGGRTALMIAVIYHNLPIVECLVKQPGININEKENSLSATALMFAAVRGDLRIVQNLLQLDGVDVNAKNKKGQTALFVAATQGNLPTVELLVEQPGVNINETDDNEATALIAAALKGHYSVVEFLVQQNGININLKDKFGNNALMNAAAYGRLPIVEFLINQSDVNVNETNREGKTALMYAASRGHLPVVQSLVKQSNITINDKDKNGHTALMHAACHGQVAVVEWLVKQPNMKITEKDNYERTALDLAGSCSDVSESARTDTAKKILATLESHTY